MSPDVHLAELCLRFARVDRGTFHPDGIRPETDADHTIMLVVYACALAEELRALRLDVGLVAQFATVHDFPEVFAGDTRTLGEYDRAAKEARERAAFLRIRRETKPFPWLADMIERYNRQKEPEARFLRYVDKIVVKLTHALNGAAGARALGVSLVELRRLHVIQAEELAAKYPELVNLLEPKLLAANAEAEAAYAAVGGLP